MAWPPTLEEFKRDAGIDSGGDDPKLQQTLDAAVAFVQRVRTDLQYDPLNPEQVDLPEPDPDVILGTLRVAGRWHARRRSVDGVIALGEMGTTRMPSFDADIDRLLRIGRHRKSVIA